jgi:hypothetical protein
MSVFENVVVNVPDCGSGLCTELGPMYTSMVEHLLWNRITISHEMMKMYLNPIRDMPEDESGVSEMIRTGHTVTSVGKDLYCLMERIINPLGLGNEYRGRERAVIWMAVLRKDGFQYQFGDMVGHSIGNYTPDTWLYDPGLVPFGGYGDATDFMYVSTSSVTNAGTASTTRPSTRP